LLGAGIAWVIGMNIAKPVMQLSEVARQIADGDLSKTTTRYTRLSDEIGELARSFDYMRKSLRDLIGHIRKAGLRMQSSSDEIFTAVHQLTAALEQQSTSVLETTTTMEAMTETSRKIVKNTDAVVSMAEKTRIHSQKGVAIAEETIDKMQEIDETNTRFLHKITTLGERSEKIGDVIQMIHDIADRTKLIAFNAALEAVGAKDTVGKRFNVVAIEIRRLADTIIESTQEIETNILEMQQGIRELVLSSDLTTTGISEGSQHTQTTAEWLKDILEAAIHTNDEAKQIAFAIQEQRIANEQILSALKDISDGTKQFVSAGNKVSSSANGMKQLAEELYRLIDRFELDLNEVHVV
jgi:methyl-accepting chemotaxis protein